MKVIHNAVQIKRVYVLVNLHLSKKVHVPNQKVKTTEI